VVVSPTAVIAVLLVLFVTRRRILCSMRSLSIGAQHWGRAFFLNGMFDLAPKNNADASLAVVC